MNDTPITAPTTIETEADLAQGVEVLVQLDPRFQRVIDLTGPLPLRRRPDGFGAMLSAIVGQQLSTSAAAAILARLQEAGLDTPQTIRTAHDTAILGCGISRPKLRYLRALVEANLDYTALRHASTTEVVTTLTALPGIGRWTAEIYAKFALGHTDVFAAGDLALCEAAKRLLDLPERPKERQMREIAMAWHPVRAVAARALWAYYRVEVKREGVL